MSITVNATLFKNQINDSYITAANAEIVIDAAINALNLFLNTALSNLSGAAGSKTGSYTSAQAGGILLVALEEYREKYKNADGTNISISNVSVSYTPSTRVLTYAERIARRLNAVTEDPPIYVSNDPVPTS